MSKIQGVVQDVTFTQGGAGNQWTTIDAIRYSTWWDGKTTDWKIGDLVQFDAYEDSLWSGMAPIPCAKDIRKIGLVISA